MFGVLVVSGDFSNFLLFQKRAATKCCFEMHLESLPVLLKLQVSRKQKKTI